MRWAEVVLSAFIALVPAAYAEQPPALGAESCDAVYRRTLEPKGVEGDVAVRYTVTETGEVTDIQVVKSSGYAELDNLALQCPRRWHYKPTMKDGKPTAISWTITVLFHKLR